jgi:hypothetical protein
MKQAAGFQSGLKSGEVKVCSTPRVAVNKKQVMQFKEIFGDNGLYYTYVGLPKDCGDFQVKQSLRNRLKSRQRPPLIGRWD